MSIAGKRAGLDGARSGLFHEAVRIIKEMRNATNGEYPRYIVWENVPGAFSSNGGADFRSVLEEICRIKEPEAVIPQPGNGSGRARSWKLVTPSRGGYSIQQAGAYPREENVSTLSQILLANAPRKYYLSPKACQGILRRASERGKALPAVLKAALERQADAFPGA